mmetsp:Transcript_2574/g.5259  ORF Transcript_2574/g.5259 Transcript_2574/m.5259 type:complete len:97 (-) Transcript_2574:396-686(-)
MFIKASVVAFDLPQDYLRYYLSMSTDLCTCSCLTQEIFGGAFCNDNLSYFGLVVRGQTCACSPPRQIIRHMVRHLDPAINYIPGIQDEADDIGNAK